jgi:hypothetical protein
MAYFEIARARNPQWVDANHNMIDLEVDFAPLDEEWLPYTCSPTDVVEHSRELYQRALAGEFGPIDNEPTITDAERWTPYFTSNIEVSTEALVQILLEKGTLTDDEVDAILIETTEPIGYRRPTGDGTNPVFGGGIA